jgi:5'-deoxynucleotidase YfbR-like HD superfamily hydrolase
MEKKHPIWKEVVAASSGDVRRLDYVWRYSSIPAIVYENTAAHSFWVTLYAAMIQNEIASDDFQTMAAVTLSACVHDLSDAVAGDVVRTFKYSSDHFKDQVSAAERRMVDRMDPKLRDLVQVSEMMAAGTGKEYVESVVKAADFMSLFQYMRREVMRGNVEIRNFYWRMVQDLKTAQIAMKDRWISPESEAYEVCLEGVYDAMRVEAIRLGDERFPATKTDHTGHRVL